MALGAPAALLRELAERWRDGFDWQARRGAHQRRSQLSSPRSAARASTSSTSAAAGRAPFPLIVTHGWPGSFLEMERVLPLLADPEAHGADAADAFDVVVPSLPGYGFSDPPRRRGTNPIRIARLWLELMAGLGYSRFGAQGGDWGAAVTTRLAHGSIPAASPESTSTTSRAPTRRRSAGDRVRSPRRSGSSSRDRDRWREEEGAYGHIQATRPQTLAYGLTDSPVGLLAWIVEKLRGWSDCGGDLFARFSPTRSSRTSPSTG